MFKKLDSLAGFPTLSATAELLLAIESGASVDADTIKFISNLFQRYFSFSYVYPAVLNDVRGVWVAFNKKQCSIFEFPQILLMLSIIVDATELHQEIIKRVREGSLNTDLEAPDEIYYFYRIHEWVDANVKNDLVRKAQIESNYNITLLRTVITYLLEITGINVNARF